jgi:hypothetical protein
LSIFTLKDEGNWIYLPDEIEVMVGTTTENFIAAKTFSKLEIEAMFKENTPFDIRFDNMILGRYIKINFKCASKISIDKPGSGENPWLFLSEISVD